MRKYDIFISYRRDDGAQYARIMQIVLENSGYSVFLDYEELRDGKFGDKIERAIKEAPVFILILTKKYLRRCWRGSDWVKKELLVAIENKKKIIPLVPDNIPVNVPFFLDSRIKAIINNEQRSPIDFGLRLHDDVREMITSRIKDEVGLNLDIFNDLSYSKILPYVVDRDTHPINYVEFDIKTGTVSKPFTSMIIGFEDIGQEIFKFLYEFSSFITPDHKRCEFKCYAIDENMDKIAGILHAKLPAIGENELSLIHTSLNSEEFWSLLTNILEDLNYIVISIDDIKTSISLLSQIYNICKINNKHKIGIFLKCKNSRIIHDISILNDMIGGDIIHPFVIEQTRMSALEDTLMKEAKEFNKILNNYVCNQYQEPTLTADEEWERCFGKNGYARLMERYNLSYYDAIIENNRRISQAVSTALNCYTMNILMGIDKKSDSRRIELLYKVIKTRKYQSTGYACNEEEAILLKNMARMEHERWISSQKLFGYTFGTNYDRSKKQCNLMCSWDELDEMTKSYDYSVVDANIIMIRKETL